MDTRPWISDYQMVSSITLTLYIDPNTTLTTYLLTRYATVQNWMYALCQWSSNITTRQPGLRRCHWNDSLSHHMSNANVTPEMINERKATYPDTVSLRNVINITHMMLILPSTGRGLSEIRLEEPPLMLDLMWLGIEEWQFGVCSKYINSILWSPTEKIADDRWIKALSSGALWEYSVI